MDRGRWSNLGPRAGEVLGPEAVEDEGVALGALGGVGVGVAELGRPGEVEEVVVEVLFPVGVGSALRVSAAAAVFGCGGGVFGVVGPQAVRGRRMRSAGRIRFFMVEAGYQGGANIAHYGIFMGTGIQFVLL